MKRLFSFIAIASLLTIPSYADFNGNGYYRVKNYGSGRWASMIDNRAEVDWGATNVELHAIQLSNDTEEVLADPASIVYIMSEGGNQYDVAAQGTSLKNLVGYPVKFGPETPGADGQMLYRIYGTYENATKYIGDKNVLVEDKLGNATTSPLSGFPNFVKWQIIPVSETGANYFGSVPTVKVGNNLYTTLFTSFPYKPYSSNVKAYYIGRIYGGAAEMIEITGNIPQGTPVIIQCAGDLSSDNKMTIIDSQPAISNNSLKGVYFNYNYRNTLVNQVKYNPATMRVLGECSDGSLGFITSPTLDAIPANTAYLLVPAGSPTEIKCLSPADFVVGIEDVISDDFTLHYHAGIVSCSSPMRITVIDLAGKTVAQAYGGSLNISHLHKGLYIAMAGNKTLKVIVN